MERLGEGSTGAGILYPSRAFSKLILIYIQNVPLFWTVSDSRRSSTELAKRLSFNNRDDNRLNKTKQNKRKVERAVLASVDRTRVVRFCARRHYSLQFRFFVFVSRSKRSFPQEL